MLVSVYTKKYSFTLFFSTAILLLPYIGFSENGEKYYLQPLGFLLATGHLEGKKESIDLFSGQLTVVFNEITPWAIMLLFTVTFFLTTAMCFRVKHKYTNAWNIKKHPKRLKGICVLLAISSCGVSLSGCNPQGIEHYDVYNMASRGRYENEHLTFEVCNGDNEIDILFKDETTGETESLIKNPLRTEAEVAAALYGNSRFVYYALYDMDKSEQKLTIDHLSIIEVDTESFSEKTIYGKDINIFNKSIMGVKIGEPSNNRFLLIYAFFLDNQSIFFVCGNEILQIDRSTGREKLIPITGKGNVVYDGRYLYYSNDQHRIVKHDTKNQSKVIFEKAIIKDFYVTETEILFCNPQDNDKIYSMDFYGGHIFKLSDRKADGKEYRMERESEDLFVSIKRSYT